MNDTDSGIAFRLSLGTLLLGFALLTASAAGQTPPVEATAQEAPASGGPAAATAQRPVEATANTAAGASRTDEGRQVYILRPGTRDARRLFELEKTLAEMSLVRRSRVDTASGSLVVLCTPAELPEVERVVKSLCDESAGKAESSGSPRQLTLDVKVVLASTAPASDTTGGLEPALARRLTELFGYRSFRVLGNQLTQAKVGTTVSSEMFFKNPAGSPDFLFQSRYSLEPDQDELAIKARLRIAAMGGDVEATFLARPDRPIIVGNTAIKSGQAFVYVLTPRSAASAQLPE